MIVVSKNPSDFVGSALGQSEANTKAILANTVGKVLIIDEVNGFLAYLITMLAHKLFAGIYAVRRRRK